MWMGRSRGASFPAPGGLMMREQSAQHQGALPRARFTLEEHQRVPLAFSRQGLDLLVAADQVLRVVGGDDEPLGAQQGGPTAERRDEGEKRQGSQQPGRQPFRCGREVCDPGGCLRELIYELSRCRKSGAGPGDDTSKRYLPVRRAALQTPSVWPRISSKCTAMRLSGTRRAHASTTRQAASGVFAPMVSPSVISSQPSS